MTKVLDWVRGNWVIVACGVVILLTLVLAPIFSGSLEEGVRQTAEERARKVSEIAGFERSPVQLEIPGQAPRSGSGVVNAALLETYREVTTALREDADAVRSLAVEHNRKGRGVVSAEAFPRPPASQRETIQFDVHQRIVRAYDALLTSVRAGEPPAADAVATELQRRESQFITNTLRKRSRADLDARESADLAAELAKARLVRYGERARELSFYASAQSLDMPPAPQQSRISTAEMFDWQWRLWIAEDLLGAIAMANADSASVVESPVKRVVSLTVLDELPGSQTSSGDSGGFGGGGISGRRGVDGEGSDSTGPAGVGAGDDAVGPVVIDSSVEAALDFSRTFTGRKSNSVYDVRNVELVVVVATEQLPKLFDALAKRNFMTVLDMELRPADAFEAARLGYIYGTAPVSEATLLIETVWLREWTAPFMPADARQALGIGAGMAMSEG
jgi:hypothetical protein